MAEAVRGICLFGRVAVTGCHSAPRSLPEPLGGGGAEVGYVDEVIGWGRNVAEGVPLEVVGVGLPGGGQGRIVDNIDKAILIEVGGIGAGFVGTDVDPSQADARVAIDINVTRVSNIIGVAGVDAKGIVVQVIIAMARIDKAGVYANVANARPGPAAIVAVGVAPDVVIGNDRVAIQGIDATAEN